MIQQKAEQPKCLALRTKGGTCTCTVLYKYMYMHMHMHSEQICVINTIFHFLTVGVCSPKLPELALGLGGRGPWVAIKPRSFSAKSGFRVLNQQKK